MIFKQIFHFKFRPFLYSLIATIGYFLCIIVLSISKNLNLYFLMSLVLYVLILLELVITSNYYNVIHKKHLKTKYEFENFKIAQYAHHIFLPSITFLGFVLFGFINNQISLLIIVALLYFGIFIVLFQNIHSYYKHEFTLNKATGYIYDFISIVTLFLYIDVILNLKQSLTLNWQISLFIFSFIISVLIILMNLRHKMSKKLTLISFATIILFTILFGLFLHSAMNINLIALITVIFYHSFDLFVDDYSVGKVNKDTLMEFLIVLMLIFALINLSGI